MMDKTSLLHKNTRRKKDESNILAVSIWSLFVTLSFK